MEMPVIVGVMVAIAFLVTFSQWFYGLGRGLREVTLDDARQIGRIVRASVISILFMIAAFFVIAIVNECPNEVEDRPGLMANLRCDEYYKIRSATEGLFQSGDEIVN